jgi:hypothetical protein
MRNYLFCQWVILLIPMIGSISVPPTICVVVGIIGFTFVLTTKVYNFSILSNNINLCFHTWKDVPSNLGMQLRSMLLFVDYILISDSSHI